jgi:uncharacterized protein (TIGR03792 family)
MVFYPSDPLPVLFLLSYTTPRDAAPVLKHHPDDPHQLHKSTCLWRRLGSGLLSFLLGALLMISVFPGQVEAAPPPVVVVEQLRLKVPSDAVTAWLEAERGSWEPWLEAQPGFLDRQLLWDPEREEGTLLIHWRSRADWQSIPDQEIARVQERFEQLAQDLTGHDAREVAHHRGNRAKLRIRIHLLLEGRESRELLDELGRIDRRQRVLVAHLCDEELDEAVELLADGRLACGSGSGSDLGLRGGGGAHN